MVARGKTGKAREELVFLPLGGTGEIGMNAYLYGFGPARDRRWLMVDLGVKFGSEREPGVDVILPDMAFMEAERHALEGLVLTHAHEDHLGAVAYLWERLGMPVYATRFTAALLMNKLEEAGLEEEVPLHIVEPGDRFALGPFDIELVRVNHSIPEPNALAIRTDAGTVVHSGDWKIDDAPVLGERIDEARLREIGAEGCLALVCDSTNAMREGHSPTEEEVAASLTSIIARAKARVAVTTFASHVGRLETVARAAHEAGRQVVVAGRAMNTVIEAARHSGYLRDVPDFQPADAFGYLPPEKVVCLCTGSQGEPRAAMARIADDSHPSIALEAGDLVIFSSKTIPGNEKAVIEIENKLAARGVEIVTSDDALVHVTGHPRRDELRQLYDWLRPGMLIPMHGEMRHMMEHAKFAREQGIAATQVVTNGEVLRLAPGAPEIVDEAPSGRLFVDGRLIVSEHAAAIRDRRKLSFVGMVAVSVIVDGRGDLVGEPQIAMEGVPAEDENATPMADIVLDVVEEVMEGLPRARRRDRDLLAETLRRAVRRAMALHWGKKPLCRVMIHQQ